MGVLDPEKVNRIKQLLKWHQRGMTISDLSSKITMNRNLVAKYLDMLQISGQVEVQTVGAAKVYYLSRRVPISALLEFSSDLVIVIDSDQRILQVNEQVPLLLNEPREALVGNRIDEIPNQFIRDLHLSGSQKNLHTGGERVTELSSMVKGEEHHFRMKQVPTAFEDGSVGTTLIIEDITSQKKAQKMLEMSEARYRGIVQSSGEAIIGKNPDGSIVSWNPAAQRLYGYNEEEILKKPVHMLVPPAFHGDLDTFLKRVLQGEYIRQHEMKMIRKDGAAIDVLITISPILAENGTILGASSIVRDITREKLEEHVRAHEDRYRTLVEDLNVGVYRSTGDPRGRFVWGNTALLNILGYHSISDLQEINVIDIFFEPEGRTKLLDELRRSGFVKNRILLLERKDGTPITVSVTALAEFDEKRDLVFINGIVQDITEFRNAGAALSV